MASSGPILRRVAVTAAGLVLSGHAVTARPGPVNTAQNPIAVSALRSYAEGRHDEAANGIRTLLPLPNLVREIERTISRSTNEAGVPAAAFRHAAVALTLETAAGVALAQPREATDAVEWACEIVRKTEPDDAFARRWQLAALAVFSAALLPDVLEDHLDHASAFYDDEPRARLAAAIAAEQRTAPALAAGRPDRRGDIERAMERLRALVEMPAIRHEALARLGRLQTTAGDLEDARSTLTSAGDGARDPDVRYIASLFLGMVEARLGRAAEARAQYEQALAARRGAQSATIALATLLATSGERQAAGELIEPLVASSAPAGDPWWSYWMGDFRLWFPLRDAVREVV